MEDENIEDEIEAEEPEEEIDSNEMFCRFTPSQMDRFAEVWLGEKPLCEKWISRDGKEAILRGLRLHYKDKKPGISGREFGESVNLVELWKTKFLKTTN